MDLEIRGVSLQDETVRRLFKEQTFLWTTGFGSGIIPPRRKMMTLQAGAKIWIPCEVKPGPFSDERLVRVLASGNSWFGFVRVDHLREPILEGETFVGALVVLVAEDTFKARLSGEAFNPELFEGLLTSVILLGPP